MKHLFKKNQIIITTLAVMIAIAGYLNYSGKLFSDTDKGAAEANAELVNQELLDISEEDIETGNMEIASTDSEVEGTPGEAVLTNSAANTTVAEAKVSREQIRAQNKETLQALIDNTNISEEEKQDAVAQMVRMTELAEQRMALCTTRRMSTVTAETLPSPRRLQVSSLPFPSRQSWKTASFRSWENSSRR